MNIQIQFIPFSLCWWRKRIKEAIPYFKMENLQVFTISCLVWIVIINQVNKTSQVNILGTVL